jgi:GNAT superfamily N-acetyltransferase
LNNLRAPDGSSLKPQLEMIRANEVVPTVPDLSAGYELRLVSLEYKHSYSQTFLTAFDDPSPFGDLMKHALPEGFFVVEHLPTGTVVAASTAAVYEKSQHPDGHSLQWVVAHSDHRGTGAGQATIAAATRVLADQAPNYSYLSTDDFRLPAISIYLKLGWKPLLYQQGQIRRWATVFEHLGKEFEESEWSTAP